MDSSYDFPYPQGKNSLFCTPHRPQTALQGNNLQVRSTPEEAKGKPQSVRQQFTRQLFQMSLAPSAREIFLPLF